MSYINRIRERCLNEDDLPLIKKRRKLTTEPKEKRKMSLKDFEIISSLGKGGFGQVYLSKCIPTGEILALKAMNKGHIWDKEKTEQVKNERDVLAFHSVPYCVQLHYSFQDKEYLYLAMEYCPGGDLRNLLDGFGRLEENEARLYMAEIVLAVDALHDYGYIHRDLKPDNFLIDKQGRIKLTDFGLSKEGPDSFKDNLGDEIFAYLGTSEVVGYSVVGSPNYMSPEVLAGSPTGYGREVDWWSIGCLFFNMVIGVTPFEGETSTIVFEKILNWKKELPMILEEVREYISEPFFDLLEGFFRDPSQRLGMTGLDNIKNHPFFDGIDWDHLDQMSPLFVPTLGNELDTRYFKERESGMQVDPEDKFAEYYEIISTSREKENVPIWATPSRRPVLTTPPSDTSSWNNIEGFTFNRTVKKTKSKTKKLKERPLFKLNTISEETETKLSESW